MNTTPFNEEKEKMNLTVLTCNYNTPDITLNMLKSLVYVNGNAPLPNVMVMNTSNSWSPNELDDNLIPYYNFRNGIHGEAVNLALNKINTRYVLLVDSDIIFLQDWRKPFNRFVDGNFTIMGKVVGNVAGKELYERVEPWYCFIDLHKLKSNKIKFFDGDRTKASKLTNKVYDVGSTMFEDVVNLGGLVANVDLENKYFKHYGGMSWRTQKYNPLDGDTDIDFGGTHPHKQLYDIGLYIKDQYIKETEFLQDIDIMGLFE